MTDSTQSCPICGRSVEPSPRYPSYLCEECASRARSADGRPLAFGNESFSGGYVAWYADNHESYPGHECYVDGIRCYADEAHMGGIVIRIRSWPSLQDAARSSLRSSQRRYH